MGNRAKLEALMPAMLRHEGQWQGTIKTVDLNGSVVEEYRSRVDCEFPDSGEFVYVQRNHNVYPDGRVVDLEFGGRLDGSRIVWDTERFAGHGWQSEDNCILLTLDRKDVPGVFFTELILLAPDPDFRCRTWHWFRDGRLYQRTLCDERRVIPD